MRKILLIMSLLVGVLVLANFGYSKYQRGKFLPRAGFSLVSSPQLDNVISACLALKFDAETQNSYKQVVIDSQNDYDMFIDKIKSQGSEYCKNISLPQIDFSSQTLIGTEAASWCRAHLERDFRRDDRNKTYRYIVEEKLNCIAGITCVARSCTYSHSINLATIPKIPGDYKLNFEFYPAKH